MVHSPRYLTLVESGELDRRIERAQALASECRLCPRRCGVKRLDGETGACGAGKVVRISTFIRHRGEEPVLSGSRGSGTVFFSHCGLRCRYCQNWQISFEGEGGDVGIDDFARGMVRLQEQGVHNINWVTPSYYVPWILAGVKKAQGKVRLPIVYNCSGYESLEALELLDGVVDIYLPDAKYQDRALAGELSHAPDYPAVNRAALAEMFRQTGDLETDRAGIARKGLIVRHLVIPGELENTRRVLDMLKETVGRSVAISLMGQYFPTPRMRGTGWDRTITGDEYRAAAEYLVSLGFENGWVQEDLGVPPSDRPDFKEEKGEMY